MTELLDLVAGPRLPAVGAVPGHDADLPVARLGAGRRQVPGRRPGALAARRCARRTRRPPAVRAGHRGRRPIRRAGPADAARSSASSARPPGRPRRRPGDLGRGRRRQWLAAPTCTPTWPATTASPPTAWDGGRRRDLLVERVHARSPGGAARALVGDRLALLGGPHRHRADRAGRPVLVAHRPNATPPSASARCGCCASSTRPPRSPPAASRPRSPSACRWRSRPGPPRQLGRWQLTVTDGKGALIRGRRRDPPPVAGPAPPGRRAALAALYAGTPVATLRLAGLASGGGPDADAALDAAFAATPTWSTTSRRVITRPRQHPIQGCIRYIHIYMGPQYGTR